MLKHSLKILVASLIGGTVAVIPAPEAQAATTVYNQPGYHQVNGRWWNTACQKYSSTVVRCTTKIWGTKVVPYNGAYVKHNGWVFNNLTYLPASRASWGSNKLARNVSWTSGGRQWKTECDTPATGRGACRTSISAGRTPKGVKWVVNNIVLFSSSSVPAVTRIPAAAKPVRGYPVEKPIAVAQAQQADARAQKVVSAALSKVGSRYVYGTAGPSTFDCSGLTGYAYKQVGVTLPRSSGSQTAAGHRVSRSQLKPGDLVFYYSPISHVAMYIGNGKIVHAANPRSGVEVVNLGLMPYSTAVRVL